MVWNAHSSPFASGDSEPRIKNIIFNLGLVEFVDTKPEDMGG